MRIYDRLEAISKFKEHIDQNYDTYRRAAKHYGVSTSFLSAVMHGKKALTSPMLGELGMKKYRPPVMYIECNHERSTTYNDET